MYSRTMYSPRPVPLTADVFLPRDVVGVFRHLDPSQIAFRDYAEAWYRARFRSQRIETGTTSSFPSLLQFTNSRKYTDFPNPKEILLDKKSIPCSTYWLGALRPR